MNDFSSLLSQGPASAWLFIPGAVLLGALHGLEPGHSKTMMAAFIIAIRGTVKQAVMLGLAATLSHTAIVWLIAAGGMLVSNRLSPERAEPWLQLLSGIIILLTAGWMAWRTACEAREAGEHHHHHGDGHHHHHPHNHSHSHSQPHAHPHRGLSPQPQTGGVIHRIVPLPQADGDRHVSHPQPAMALLSENPDAYQDAHQRAHADDIRRRFSGREVTDGQILLFGLTGGLIPCPAAITVLLLCIQVKQFTLGATLVFCFSIGLALTLVSVGVVTALSVRHVSRRWSGFSRLAQRAPWLSCLLIAGLGLYMAWHGIHGIRAGWH